jgi:hypothetical protein
MRYNQQKSGVLRAWDKVWSRLETKTGRIMA